MAAVENSFVKKEIKDNLNSLPNGVITAPFVSGNAEILRSNAVVLTTYTLQALDLSRIIRIPASVTADFDITIPQSFTGPSARRFMIINESDAIVRIIVDGTLTLNYETAPFVLTKNTFFDIYRVSTLNYIVVNTPQAGGDFIPLSGTTPENRVSGAIEFIPENDAMFEWNDELENKNDFFPYENGFSFRNNGIEIFLFSKNGVLRSDIDSSEFALDDKLFFAQRSYVESPQTLINALNNCDVTQLATIKTILGIL
jgi:hypothetical protein